MIGIVGGGAFGTALACVMRRAGREVRLWAREPEVVASVNVRGMNPRFLAGAVLPPGIEATDDLGRAAEGAALVLLAPPAQHMRAVAEALRACLDPGTPVVSCAKGVERGTLALMPEVLGEALPGAGRRLLERGPVQVGEDVLRRSWPGIGIHTCSRHLVRRAGKRAG